MTKDLKEILEAWSAKNQVQSHLVHEELKKLQSKLGKQTQDEYEIFWKDGSNVYRAISASQVGNSDMYSLKASVSYSKLQDGAGVHNPVGKAVIMSGRKESEEYRVPLVAVTSTLDILKKYADSIKKEDLKTRVIGVQG